MECYPSSYLVDYLEREECQNILRLKFKYILFLSFWDKLANINVIQDVEVMFDFLNSLHTLLQVTTNRSLIGRNVQASSICLLLVIHL